MTASRNAELLAAHRTLTSVLVDLDRAGYVTTSAFTSAGPVPVSIHLEDGVTAREALTALELTVVRSTSLPVRNPTFTTADAVYDTTAIRIFGDPDPHPDDDLS
jgi:hypothetical protein